MNYGLRYNSEVKLEGLGEVGLNNLFGTGNNGLFYFRENKRQTDIRFSMKQPYLLGAKLNTLFSLYYKKDVQESFAAEEKGISFQQQVDLPRNFTLSWVFRINKIHEFELISAGPFPFDFSLFLSDLSCYLVRDSRDDKFDPQKGSFFSANLTYSPKFLGSELTYISFFGQYSFYKNLLPGLVWASNFRLGLASAFDQVLIPSKRFYAGGGNSIRGFKQDRVGPIDPYLDRPVGGNVLMIMNQELRFPVYRSLKSVVFYDLGNVFETVRDARLSDFRQGLGLGLRFESPVGLVRLDYGFNLRPRLGEPKGAFFMSIGQAF